MADLTSEINQMMGQSCYAIPDDVDEEDLMHELDALEDDLAAEPAMGSTPSYLQVGCKEQRRRRTLLSGRGGQAAVAVGRVMIEVCLDGQAQFSAVKRRCLGFPAPCSLLVAGPPCTCTFTPPGVSEEGSGVRETLCADDAVLCCAVLSPCAGAGAGPACSAAADS
jgi:hypothetical protein